MSSRRFGRDRRPVALLERGFRSQRGLDVRPHDGSCEAAHRVAHRRPLRQLARRSIVRARRDQLVPETLVWPFFIVSARRTREARGAAMAFAEQDHPARCTRRFTEPAPNRSANEFMFGAW